MADPAGPPASQTAKTAVTLAVLSLLGTLGTAYLSARKVDQAEKTTEARVSSTRVETGTAISNANGPRCDTRWEPWRNYVSSKTQYVGIKRHVRFREAFADPPRLVVALKVINLRSLDLVLKDIGYVPEGRAEVDRLRQFHVLSFVADAETDGFTLLVGVGMPARAGEALSKYFRTKAPKQATIDDVVGIAAACKYEPGDNWMLNFYEAVGTIEVTWIAQAAQR